MRTCRLIPGLVIACLLCPGGHVPGSSAGIPGAESPVSRSVDVLGFGADPTGKEDSTGAIQSAIDHAGTRLVFIPSGTYRFRTLRLPGGTRLAGEGNRTVLRPEGSGVPLPVTEEGVTLEGLKIDATSVESVDLVYVAGSGFILRGVSVFGVARDDGENGRIRIAKGASNARVEKCTFDGTNISLLVSGNDVLVQDNRFLNYRNGIFLKDASGFVVSNNRFASVGGVGVVRGYDAILLENAENGIISGNLILAVREHGVYIGGGVGSGSCSNIIVIGNVIRNVEQTGIKALGSGIDTGFHEDLLISGNIIVGGRGETRNGIEVGKSRRVAINGNLVRNMNHGIEIVGCSGVTVAGNHVEEMQRTGIHVEDVYAGNRNVLVEGNSVMNGNRIRSEYPGIWVNPSGGFANRNVFVLNNQVSDEKEVPDMRVGVKIEMPRGKSLLDGAISSGNVGSP